MDTTVSIFTTHDKLVVGGHRKCLGFSEVLNQREHILEVLLLVCFVCVILCCPSYNKPRI